MAHVTAPTTPELLPSGIRRTPTGEAEFEEVRPRLLAIAQRILGDRGRAEDVVQDAWIRWQRCDRAAVTSPCGFLTTATKRLAINAATSARARRELSSGASLPDAADPAADPSSAVEQREALAGGIRTLLERLAPTECAAFVLRQAFDLPYTEIAGMLEVSEANARQLVCRAGGHLTMAARRSVGSDEQRQVVEAFVGAARRSEVRALTALLTRDVTTTTLDAAA